MEIEYDRDGKPQIGGWLYLFGVLLFFTFCGSIVFLVINLINLKDINEHDLFFTMSMFSMLYSFFIFIYVIYVISLFLKKSKNFPDHYILLYLSSFYYCILSTCYTFFDTGNIIEMYPFGTPYITLLRSYCIICVLNAYFSSSERVMKTFIY